MKFYSHCLWESEKGRNPVSVVLQQVQVTGRHCLLVCVCDGGKSGEAASLVSGYFTECLVEWFHHKFIPALQRKCPEEEQQGLLRKELIRIREELTEYGERKGIPVEMDVCGMLICEECFCYFSQGDIIGYLFNRRFNQKQRSALHKKMSEAETWDQMQVISGELQKGIAVLLGSADYASHVTEEEMTEVLFADKLKDQDIEKRLKELWRADIERGGGRYAGAVYFRTE